MNVVLTSAIIVLTTGVGPPIGGNIFLSPAEAATSKLGDLKLFRLIAADVATLYPSRDMEGRTTRIRIPRKPA